MKKLFVTDLDGTFLDKSAQVTPLSAELINDFIKGGGNFTFATARTASSAAVIMKDVEVNVPCLLMNGVSIYDLKEKRYIKNEYFTSDESQRAAEVFREENVIPFLYKIDRDILTTYYCGFQCKEMEDFFNYRDKMPGRPFERCDDLLEAADDRTVYFSVQGKHDDLERVVKLLDREDICKYAFYRDVYNTGIWFLEVFSKNASKYNGVRFLREYGGFDVITSFGDNLNDIPMFEASDRKIAVGNAKDEVKGCADEVIGCNYEDAVAKYIRTCSHSL